MIEVSTSLTRILLSLGVDLEGNTFLKVLLLVMFSLVLFLYCVGVEEMVWDARQGKKTRCRARQRETLTTN
jgi:succinate dehydrogenase/fumarate reductase cytochrome b subunit